MAEHAAYTLATGLRVESGGPTGQDACRAIQKTIREMERRRPGSTAAVTYWRTHTLPSGELIGVPDTRPRRGRLTVAEAERRTRARMKRS